MNFAQFIRTAFLQNTSGWLHLHWTWIVRARSLCKREKTINKMIEMKGKISNHTAQKMNFSIKDFFSKCDQIRRKWDIWSHLLKKSLMEKLHFLCSVIDNRSHNILTLLIYLHNKFDKITADKRKHTQNDLIFSIIYSDRKNLPFETFK